MRFDYYYGSQADQFSFIRIPRVMIKDPVFAGLSAYAKLLYSVLLDRMSLSSKNGWLDEENRVYIVYPVNEAQEDLGIGKKKAMEVIAELVEFGLLEKKRRGQGLPSLLYVKSFMSGVGASRQDVSSMVQSEVSEPEHQETQKTQEKQKAQSEVSEGTSQMFMPSSPEVSNQVLLENESADPKVRDLTPQESREPATPVQDGQAYATETVPSTQDTMGIDYSVQHGLTDSEVSEWALPEVSDSAPLEVSKPVLLEVPKPAPLSSKTDNNYTYRSYISSHHINVGPAGQAGNDKIRCDGKAANSNPSRGGRGNYVQLSCDNSNSTGEAQTIQVYRELIHENIRYDDLCAVHRFDRNRIDGIVDLILETVFGKDEYIRIASNLYPAEIVRSKFLKLGHEHIEYVLDCLDTNTTKVRNIKKYLLAVLFNAPSTMNGYYLAEVNHDMPQYARRAQ